MCILMEMYEGSSKPIFAIFGKTPVWLLIQSLNPHQHFQRPLLPSGVFQKMLIRTTSRPKLITICDTIWVFMQKYEGYIHRGADI